MAAESSISVESGGGGDYQTGGLHPNISHSGKRAGRSPPQSRPLTREARHVNGKLTVSRRVEESYVALHNRLAQPLAELSIVDARAAVERQS